MDRSVQERARINEENSVAMYFTDATGVDIERTFYPPSGIAQEIAELEALVAFGLGFGRPTREPEYYKTYRTFGNMPDLVLVDLEGDTTIVELTKDSRGEWRVVP